jgi:DUF2905 family protein
MADLGKLILGIGLVLVVIGGALIVAGRIGIPVGRLPGDFSYRGKHVAVYFPLVTSILVSLVLSGVLYLISRFRR